MKSEPVELVLSNKKFRIVQHFYNGRNLGDNWLFLIKRLMMNQWLTDYRYAHYLDTTWDKHPEFLSIEQTIKFLQALDLVDENGNIITEENSND